MPPFFFGAAEQFFTRSVLPIFSSLSVPNYQTARMAIFIRLVLLLSVAALLSPDVMAAGLENDLPVEEQKAERQSLFARGNLPAPMLDIDSNDVDTNNYPLDPILDDYVLPALTLLITIPVHELGHFGVAHAVGARSVEMIFLDVNGSSFTLAANLVDTVGLTRLDKGLIGIAGVGATRLMAELSDRISRGFDHRLTYPTFGQKLTSALFIYGRLDFALYVVQDMVTNLLQKPGSDIDILVTQIAGRATLPRVGTYLGLVSLAVIDLYLDLDRLGYHFTIFSGKQVPHPSTWSRLRLGPLPGINGLGAHFSMSF